MFIPSTLGYLPNLFLAAFVAGLGLLTMLGFLGRRAWLLDLPNHFRVQYFFLLVLAAVGCMAFGWLWGAGVALGLALVNLGVILPRLIPQARAASNGSGYRLLLSNVLKRNRSYHKVLDLVNSQQPDLVVLIEPDRTWLENLAELHRDYPFWYSNPRKDAYGIAVLSRQPFDSAEVIYLGSAGVPTVVVRFHLNNDPDRLLTVIATHPPPPKGARHTARRNDQLRALAKFVRQQRGALMLCGDLNLSPWSPHFFDLIRDSGLSDSGRGFGIQPTWPADNFWLRTPIDHCLVSSHVMVRRRWIGPRVGSDHLPVLLDFSLAGKSDLPGE
jgi:endonuclease/exonuclease/phosphatase (EEP) superfamily protein YafD